MLGCTSSLVWSLAIININTIEKILACYATLTLAKNGMYASQEGRRIYKGWPETFSVLAKCVVTLQFDNNNIIQEIRSTTTRILEYSVPVYYQISWNNNIASQSDREGSFPPPLFQEKYLLDYLTIEQKMTTRRLSILFHSSHHNNTCCESALGPTPRQEEREEVKHDLMTERAASLLIEPRGQNGEGKPFYTV